MMFHERYVDVLDEMCGDIDCSYNNSLLSGNAYFFRAY